MVHSIWRETLNMASRHKRFFFGASEWARGHVMDRSGTPGTPQKSAFFQGRGRKKMKELGEVTFMKEWMKALLVAVILAPTDLRYLVLFPRYGRLKRKKVFV